MLQAPHYLNPALRKARTVAGNNKQEPDNWE